MQLRPLLFLVFISTVFLQSQAQNTFPASGNVGIGTGSPLKPLQVKGAGAFGNRVTSANAPRALNLADTAAVMRILRVDPTNAPAVELLSRTTADGSNVAYWDMYAEPSDASFRIRDRQTGSNLDRLTISHAYGNVGIGTTAPNASSLLDLTSITKGLLIPRMSQSQRDAIGSPVQGLLIFQNNGTKGFYYYDAGWKPIAGSSSGGANTTLSNLTSPTAINQHLLPNATRTFDLGSSALSWRNLYLRDDIYLDGTRFVSNAPGTASFNAFLGSNAGLSVSNGISNTAVGQDALRNTTTGSWNTAVGKQALYTNVSGNSNVAIGNKALFTSATAIGSVAIGDSALANYNDDNQNDLMVAVGYQTLASNTGGIYNTSLGGRSLFKNTNGFVNTAVGVETLYSNTTGAYNTAIGAFADVNSSDINNSTAVGYSAIATASNQVMLGNTTVTSVMAAGPHVIYSDGRFKKDIQEGVPGLSFINRLRPVTYHYDIHGLNNHLRSESGAQTHGIEKGNRQEETALRQKEEENIKAKEQILYTGFVAQEVEQAAKELKYDFSGVHKPASEKDAYGLSYSDFVVPLVKAVQELSKENEQLKKHNDDLEARLQKLEAMLLKGNNTPSVSAAYLENAMPNPSNGSTLIRYGLPESSATARLTLVNAKGQVLKEVSLSNRGAGQVTINTTGLPAGVYTYTLVIDGQQAVSKQLVIAR